MTPRELIAEYIAAARAGDWSLAFAYFADDVEIHIPGRSSLAGDRVGREEAVRYIQTVRERFGEENLELEVIDVLSSDERVAILVAERFHRPEGSVEIRRSNVYTVRDDEIVDVRIYEADQYAVDDLVHAMSAVPVARTSTTAG
jgi:ketosteroid isomerase-like protein